MKPRPAAPTASPSNHLGAGLPLLALGFRPFYLLAAAFAVLAVPLWLLRYDNSLPGLPALDLNWHMHEMVFGFAVAVIIGFLFTAARNWTGLPTPRGKPLAILTLLWLAGRIAMLSCPAVLAAVIDLLFLPCAAWPLYRVLKQSGNTRNLKLLGILALLWSADVVFHGSRLGWLDMSSLGAIHGGILLIVLLETVIGGRVMPMFTANAIPGSKPRSHLRLDQASIALTGIAAAAWVSHAPSTLLAICCFATAIAQGARLVGWQPWKTLRQPLLWILHLAYGWIALGFLLLGLAALDVLPASTAFHALAIASMAGLILGMITRTALGHTGRLLKAGRAETAMYCLLQTGAIARLCANMPFADVRQPCLLLAALCWSSAFLLYLAVYTPYLMRPRLDGREG